MPLIPFAIGGFMTAAAMALVGWGLPGLAMMGPRAAVRIAALVPQVEVAVLFLVGVPIWARLLRAEASPALRRALAVTVRGPRWAVWRAAGAQGKAVGTLLAGGAVAWLVAGMLSGERFLPRIASTRLLLLAFATFGIGIGAWSSAVWRGARAAVGFCVAVLFGMLVLPVAIGPVVAAVGPRPVLIQAAMLCNPWIVAAGISHLDLLHMEWIYALSPLGTLEAFYPGLGLATATYGGVGMGLLALSVLALRRAGPTDGGCG